MPDSPKPARIFGPVPSRRLGRSLGVDLLPHKTCSFDCVYCQIGRTTCRTIERKEYVPADEVLAELAGKLASAPDYITLSGSGEPTLHEGIGEVISGVRSMTDIPVAVLTNASLLWMPEVRNALLRADLVAPSLDAPNEALFQAINRPAPPLAFDRVVDGLVAFREAFSGLYWLEVFLLEGLNAGEKDVERMAEIVRRIRPDRVQLNTVTRPPAEASATPVSREGLERIARAFGPNAEVIADFPATLQARGLARRCEDVAEMLRRRPCTLEDLAKGLRIHRNEAAKFVEALLANGTVDRAQAGGKTYFRARQGT